MISGCVWLCGSFLAPHNQKDCYFTQSDHVQETCAHANIYVRFLQQRHSPTYMGGKGPIIAVC